MSHLSKGWSICQKGGPFVKRCGPFLKRCARNILSYTTHHHFLKKLVFFPPQDQIRSLHAQDTLTKEVLARAFSAVPCCFSCTVTRRSLEVAQWSSHGGAVFTWNSFASRDPMFSYFGQKVQDKPRKLLFKPRKLLFQASKVAFSSLESCF